MLVWDTRGLLRSMSRWELKNEDDVYSFLVVVSSCSKLENEI
jgi:hypothetical protein